MLRIIFYILGGIILGWLVYRFIYLRLNARKYKRSLNEVFIIQEIIKPNLKFGYSYSYPSFEVVFIDEAQFNLAETKGLTKDFINKIQTIHQGIKDFEAERAVHFTWEGRSYNWTAIENK